MVLLLNRIHTYKYTNVPITYTHISTVWREGTLMYDEGS